MYCPNLSWISQMVFELLPHFKHPIWHRFHSITRLPDRGYCRSLGFNAHYAEITKDLNILRYYQPFAVSLSTPAYMVVIDQLLDRHYRSGLKTTVQEDLSELSCLSVVSRGMCFIVRISRKWLRNLRSASSAPRRPSQLQRCARGPARRDRQPSVCSCRP